MCNTLHRNWYTENTLKPTFSYTHGPGIENPVYSYLGAYAF